MRRAALSLGLLALAACESVDTTPAAMPDAFHGTWGVTPADCRAATSEAPGQLLVERDWLVFQDSVTRVETVLLQEDGALRVDGVSEGMETMWSATFLFTLAEDGRLIRRDVEEERISDPIVYSACTT